MSTGSLRRYGRVVALLLGVALAVSLLAAYRGGSGPARTSSALSLQQQFIQVVKKVAPSVVQVETGAGLGSGVVFDGRGDIVTNAHVVGSAQTFKVTLANGKRFDGTLVGRFVPDDLAVIRVNATGLRPATFADSSKLQVGSIVMAIGNPLGLRSSVTDGIVSALGRTVSEPSGATLPNTIQTSASINPGNSGGALVDLAGNVVGIPTLAAVDPAFGGTSGIGFAIASSRVRDIASQLIENGRVVNSRRAYLGIRIASITGGNGVLVGEVVSGGPAARAGIRAGDVITAIDGQPAPSPDELASILAAHRPGQQVTVSLLRQDGSQSKATVTLGELPSG